MKIKELRNQIRKFADEKGLGVIEEYTTQDKTKIDIAILRDDEKLLAMEFENTYKWIQQRIMYNSVKAYRAGFKRIVFVYPFNQKTIHGSWVLNFIKDDLEMDVEVTHPNDCLRMIEKLL